MEAKNSSYLTPVDYLCIVLRKYFRLAIPVYTIGALFWCLNSRVFNGPIWHNTNIIYEDCEKDWWKVLFFVNNLDPMTPMEPYKGCFQQAFPLQLDL